MDIKSYIDVFVGKNHRYKSYSKIVKPLLSGGKQYSLNMQPCYGESEYLPIMVPDPVKDWKLKELRNGLEIFYEV